MRSGARGRGHAMTGIRGGAFRAAPPPVSKEPGRRDGLRLRTGGDGRGQAVAGLRGGALRAAPPPAPERNQEEEPAAPAQWGQWAWPGADSRRGAPGRGDAGPRRPRKEDMDASALERDAVQFARLAVQRDHEARYSEAVFYYKVGRELGCRGQAQGRGGPPGPGRRLSCRPLAVSGPRTRDPPAPPRPDLRLRRRLAAPTRAAPEARLTQPVAWPACAAGSAPRCSLKSAPPASPPSRQCPDPHFSQPSHLLLPQPCARRPLIELPPP